MPVELREWAPTPVYLQYVTSGDDLRNDEARGKKQITATMTASGKGGGKTPTGGRKAGKQGGRTLTPFSRRLVCLLLLLLWVKK